MTDLEYWKWRCTECREEPMHTVYTRGKFVTVGACKCKGARQLEMVPLTKRAFQARLR